MGMGGELSHLARVRRLILAAEVGALLHDVGKLSSQFLRAKATDCREQDRHGEVLQLFAGEIPPPLAAFFATPLASFWGERRSPRDEPVPTFLEGVRLEHFLTLHHGNKRANHTPLQLLPFARLLQACDRFSSAEDKANPSDLAKQPYLATHRSTPFGREERIVPQQLDELRRALWPQLAAILHPSRIVSARRALIPLLRRAFSPALAETRRSANDLDLFHHSWSVASYLKASLTGALLGGPLPQEMGDVPRQVLCLRDPLSPKEESSLRRFLEEGLALGSFFFQEADERWFLVAPLTQEMRNAVERSLRARWPSLQFHWAPFPLGQEAEAFAYDPILAVPPGGRGILLGLRAFVRFELFDTLLAKQLEHIEPGLDFPGLVRRTDQVLALSRMMEGDRLQAVIESRGRHLANLRQARRLGKLNGCKEEEYTAKRAELIRLRRNLYRLRKRNESLALAPGESLEEAKARLLLFIDQVFSWLHPPDPSQVGRRWTRRGQSAERVALRWVLRKGPSLSRLMAMMEEGEAFLEEMVEHLGRPLTRAPGWAVFPRGAEVVSATAEIAFNRFAKMRGRLPWAVLPTGNWQESAVFQRIWKQVASLQASRDTLTILFSDGERWFLPRLLGSGEADSYYLYGWIHAAPPGSTARNGLTLGKETLIELEQLQAGDRLLVLTGKDGTRS